jgi:hypothetical protein
MSSKDLSRSRQVREQIGNPPADHLLRLVNNVKITHKLAIWPNYGLFCTYRPPRRSQMRMGMMM